MKQAPNYGTEPADFAAYRQAVYAARLGVERDEVNAAYPAVAKTTTAAVNRLSAALMDLGRAIRDALPAPVARLFTR